MNKSIFKGILNPIVGPIVVTVITLTFIVFFLLTNISAISLVDNIRISSFFKLKDYIFTTIRKQQSKNYLKYTIIVLIQIIS